MLLPASHLAQLHADAENDDNVCVACGTLIETAVAELVVLHDERTILARLAHPDCVRSGAYGWEGTTAAVQALTLRPEGLDVATMLAWRRTGQPRALILLEPRIQVSLDGSDDDSLERLFAVPLGLTAANRPLRELSAPMVPGRVERQADGLRIVSDDLRISVPGREDLIRDWAAQAAGTALVILGRGLGIGGPERDLLTNLDQALMSRPCWAGTFAVAL